MPSDLREAWVWNWLPGLESPVLCGRFQWANAPGGKRVGRFVYTRDYLAGSGALALDPVLLPLRDAEFTTTDLNGIFNALRDAGPDNWGRLLIDRLHGPQDDLGYLVRAQGERTGSIDFSQARDEAPPAPHALSGLEQLAQAARAVRNVESGGELPPELLRVLALGTPSGGARPKFSLRLDGRTWIAKFPSSHDPAHLPPVPIQECAALDLADRCNIVVPDHRIEMVEGTPVLLVARFDRQGFTRLAYASARTVLWSDPAVQRFSYMGSYNNLAQQFGRWITNPTRDRRALYERVVFNAITGNFDDHDLNHGLLFDPDKQSYGLSPLFDPVAVGHLTASNLAMGFGDDGAQVSLDNLLSRTDDFGLSAQDAREIIAVMSHTVAAHWQDHLRERGAQDAHIQSLAPRFAFAVETARKLAPRGR